MGDERRSAGRASEHLLALLLAALTCSSLIELVPRMVGIDYYLFWVVGEAVESGELRDVYAADDEKRVGQAYHAKALEQVRAKPRQPAAQRRAQAAQVRSELENYSTPFLYAAMGAPTSGDYARDLDRAQFFAIALYALGFAALCRVLGFSWLATAAAFAALTVWFSPFMDDTSTGNVNRMQVGWLGLLAGVLATTRLRGRDVLAGFLLGLAIAFKPNLAYAGVALAALLVATRQWRRLARGAAGGLVATAFAIGVSSWWFGSFEVWSRWSRKLPGLMTNWASDLGNSSLARVLSDRAGVQAAGALPYVVLGSVIATFAALAWAASRRGSAPPDSFAASLDTQELDDTRVRWDVFALALGATASVLSAALAWQHYSLLCTPLALYLLRPDGASRARTAIRALALIALALLSVDLFRRVSPESAFDPAVCLVLGGVLVFALGLVEAFTDRRAQLLFARRADAVG